MTQQFQTKVYTQENLIQKQKTCIDIHDSFICNISKVEMI